MIERRRAGSVMFAAMALAFTATQPAFAQDATTPLPAVEAGAAPATTDPAAPAATDPAAAAAPAAAAPAPAAAAEEAAPTPPPGISAEIITPDVIKDMRERIVQQVTILSITAANKVHTGVDQAAIDKIISSGKILLGWGSVIRSSPRIVHSVFGRVANL